MFLCISFSIRICETFVHQCKVYNFGKVMWKRATSERMSLHCTADLANATWGWQIITILSNHMETMGRDFSTCSSMGFAICNPPLKRASPSIGPFIYLSLSLSDTLCHCQGISKVDNSLVKQISHRYARPPAQPARPTSLVGSNPLWLDNLILSSYMHLRCVCVSFFTRWGQSGQTDIASEEQLIERTPFRFYNHL